MWKKILLVFAFLFLVSPVFATSVDIPLTCGYNHITFQNTFNNLCDYGIISQFGWYTDVNGANEYVSWHKIDFSVIPSGKIITAASLEFTSPALSGSDFAYSVYRGNSNVNLYTTFGDYQNLTDYVLMGTSDTQHSTVTLNPGEMSTLLSMPNNGIHIKPNTSFTTTHLLTIHSAVLHVTYADPQQIATIVPSPASANVTVGVPFTVDVVVNSQEQPFNAVQANVDVSSNLSVTGLLNANMNPCNLQYVETPTTSKPSFAGALFNASKTLCNVYTLTITPKSAGTGTIHIYGAQVKLRGQATELVNNADQGTFSYTIQNATPVAGTEHDIDDTVLGTGSEQWNFPSSGHWSHGNFPNETVPFYNNSISWSNSASDTVDFKFTGVQVSLYGFTDPQNGIASIAIDGVPMTTVDMYNATRAGNVLLWSSPPLSLSQHTLTVAPLGSHSTASTGDYIGVDLAKVITTEPAGNFTIDTYPLNTYATTVSLSGQKTSDITQMELVNGLPITLHDTTWDGTATFSGTEYGAKQFVITGKRTDGSNPSSITITINRHILGDINGDGVVNLTDASLFAVDWGKSTNLNSALSNLDPSSQTVDLKDFSELADLIR